jgi:Pyridine nucleotide-disulphide oxidoreductase
MRLRLDTAATGIDPARRLVAVRDPAGGADAVGYDRLIVATGAVPQRPPIAGLDSLGPEHGLHVLHTMGDTFAVTETLQGRRPRTAAIVGGCSAEQLSATGLCLILLDDGLRDTTAWRDAEPFAPCPGADGLVLGRIDRARATTPSGNRVRAHPANLLRRLQVGLQPRAKLRGVLLG